MNFSNNGFSVLSGPVAPGDTVITLAAGTGSRFPASDFLVTLVGYDEVGNENKWEICKCSGRDGDVLTVARAQEGTTASAWPDATRIENRVTAGTMAGFVIKEIDTPANTSPANSADGVIETPELTGSPYYEIYGASQSAIQVQVSTSSSFLSPLYSSGDQAAGTSFTLPPGILSTSTQYYWRIRYKSARGTYSDWSTPTSFATAAQFNSYIPEPVATPSNFGDALEGGYRLVNGGGCEGRDI